MGGPPLGSLGPPGTKMVIHVLVCIVNVVCYLSNKGSCAVPCSGVATGPAAAGSGSPDTLPRHTSPDHPTFVDAVILIVKSRTTIIITSIPGTGVSI